MASIFIEERIVYHDSRMTPPDTNEGELETGKPEPKEEREFTGFEEMFPLVSRKERRRRKALRK